MLFRTSSSSPSYLNPKLQRRLLGYVALAAVLLIAFQMWPGNRPAPEADPNAGAAGSPDDLDFRVRNEADAPSIERPLEPDEFRSFAEAPAAPAAQPQPSLPRQDDVAIDPVLLSDVEDNTLGIRRNEASAFYYTLDRARQIPAAKLEKSAERGLQYLNLMNDPTLYRGKPVTVIGLMRRVYEFPANENDYGLKTLYEAWVFSSDSGTHPYRIVSSSLAPDIDLLQAQQEPITVRVTGYFFKREGYDTPGGLHVAPTILAGRLERYISPNAPPPADGLAPIMLGVVAAFGLILATTLLSFAWNDRRSPPRVRTLPDLSDKTNAELAAIDALSVREQLREMEERERYGEWYPAPSGPAAQQHESNGHAHQDTRATLDLPTPPPPTRNPRVRDLGDTATDA